MSEQSDMSHLELICAIVNDGLGSKVVKFAKQHGVLGGTITLGKGTVSGHILSLMGLTDVRKEIVYLIAERETAYNALEDLNNHFKFHKPNHGIAFTTTICGVFGKKGICENIINNENEEHIMYHIITAIVDKGKAEDVIEAATKAGSKGGTIINARGSGIHETSKLFAMDIEPEKEIVIILSETDSTEKIVDLIKKDLEMDKPGNGIIYIQNAGKTYGIYK